MRFGPEHLQFPSIAEMVRISRGRDSLPNLRVHDHDDMFAWSEAVCGTPAIGTMAYFRAGLVIADTFRQIIDGWCGAQPLRVLDFACGYGRSLRYTVADFGDSVWAGDILPDAVDFVREEFGATRSLPRPIRSNCTATRRSTSSSCHRYSPTSRGAPSPGGSNGSTACCGPTACS
jgi:SAM-dependent methyltransferase